MFEAGDKTRRAKGAEPLSLSAVKLGIRDGRHVFEFSDHDSWKELRWDVQNRIAVARATALILDRRGRAVSDAAGPSDDAARLSDPSSAILSMSTGNVIDRAAN